MTRTKEANTNVSHMARSVGRLNDETTEPIHILPANTHMSIFGAAVD
jgi:hypothetical protein